MVTKGPDLAELRSLLVAEVLPGHSNDDAARRMWWAALATLQQDFLLPATADPSQEPLAGVWLAAPLPALYEPALLERLQGWVWAPPQQLQALLPTGGGLLPSQRLEAVAGGGLRRLDLRQGDGTDPLLLLITPNLQVALCLDGGAEARRLVVRFEPEVLGAALGLIDARLRQEAPEEAEFLRRKQMPWPSSEPGAFVPQDWTPQTGTKPSSRKRKSSTPMVTEETIGDPPPKNLFDHFLSAESRRN